jgi:hypothetical protein
MTAPKPGIAAPTPGGGRRVLSARDLAYQPMLKIERAKHHINTLSAKVDAFIAQKPFEMYIFIEPAKKRAALRTRAKEPIPIEFSLLAGDAIHNLRAALDLTIFGLIKDRAPSVENIAFPFAKSEKALESTIMSRQIQFAGKKVVEAVTAMKPYPGGNAVLCAVHDLDIGDKHRLLLLNRRVAKPTADLLGKCGLGLPICGPGVLIFTTPEDEDLVVWNNVIVKRPPSNPVPVIYDLRAGRRHNAFWAIPWEHKTKVQPTFDITFTEGLLLDLGPLVATLRVMANAVEEAVILLTEAFAHPDNV